VLRSSLLCELPWIDHGFGTRTDVVSQAEMASLKQIHSAVVLAVECAGLAGEGDALVTAQARVPVSIRTADCYPILLADTRNRAVAAVHAGWRGTAGRIAIRTIEQLQECYGTEPADLRVAIGPGIGGCCYQVGIEVARQFGLEEAGTIDLAEMNHRLLVENGVAAEHIDVLGGCTQCDAHLFHSFRRDKERAGRMVSWISRVL
jgi:polyphenol oxidase